MKRSLLIIPAMLLSFQVAAKPGAPRLETILEQASRELGTVFMASDFILAESRELATSQFTMWVQAVRGVPVRGSAIRLWTDKASGNLVQLETHLKPEAVTNKQTLSRRFDRARFTKSALGSRRLQNFVTDKVQEEISGTSDARILGLKARDEWHGNDLVRVVEVRSRRGKHTVEFSLLRGEVTAHSYEAFSPADAVIANVFAMYEEVEGSGERLPHTQAELKHLSSVVPVAGTDPFAPLRTRTWLEISYDPILANTEAGRARGYWSMESLRAGADSLVGTLPTAPNDFSSGLQLRGKFANVNIHPAAAEAFPDTIAWAPSASYLGVWQPTPLGWKLVPSHGLAGKPLASAEDLLSRVPVRLADHNAAEYIKSGVDEVQVYYSVTTFMEALNEMGLTDPELSTKAFDAFLFDPDIGMRDNAYYTDNTINFTTYSPGAPNYARDNPTIWHELGHGIMDRVMGPFIRLADTGGLSEGMADFLAMLVVEHQTNGADFPGKEKFRIINQTGFNLTNEVHDDGEAYGGAMNDMLQAAIGRDGRRGLVAMTDLTLEAMRLTRNHPGLTAQDWFNHMLAADRRGSSVRLPEAYGDLIRAALAGRNFSFDASQKPADMEIKVGDRVLTSENEGSRENPIAACDPDGSVHYDLNLSLKDGDAMSFEYPVTVKVEFKTHALQGAIKWAQEENNPNVYTIASAADVLSIPLDASTAECDAINQEDGSCKDYAYVQVFNAGEEKARAKKRFYLKIKPGQTTCP